MKHETYVVYLLDGTKQAVAGSNIFKATKEAGIKNKDIDFFTAPSNDNFVFVEGKWVRGKETVAVADQEPEKPSEGPD